MKNEIVKKVDYTRYKIYHNKSGPHKGECAFALDYGDKLKFRCYVYSLDKKTNKFAVSSDSWTTIKPKPNGYNVYYKNGSFFRNVSNHPRDSLPVVTTEVAHYRLGNVLETFAKNNNLDYDENLSHTTNLLRFCYPILKDLPDEENISLSSRFVRKSKSIQDLFHQCFKVSDSKFIDNVCEIMQNVSVDRTLAKGYVAKNKFSTEDMGRFISVEGMVDRKSISPCKTIISKMSKRARENLLTNDKDFRLLSHRFKVLADLYVQDSYKRVSLLDNRITKECLSELSYRPQEFDIPEECESVEGKTLDYNNCSYTIRFILDTDELADIAKGCKTYLLQSVDIDYAVALYSSDDEYIVLASCEGELISFDDVYTVNHGNDIKKIISKLEGMIYNAE